MKKIILYSLIAFSGIVILESFGEIQLGKRDGTEPGHTGSPGDSLKNCTVCHGGFATPVDGWITSDIPASGYVPGETYTIKATNTEFGATRFGFQVSPQALNGDLLGTLVITDTTTTKLVGNDKYVTYRSGGVDGVDSLSWTFNWVAPASGTGEVIFYGAFNSNYEGHKGGDKTYLTQLVVQENTSTGMSNISDRISHVSVYPNPVTDVVNVSFELLSTAYVKADVLDMNGKVVTTVLEGTYHGTISKNINTSMLASGTYFIRLDADGKSTSRKIVVTH